MGLPVDDVWRTVCTTLITDVLYEADSRNVNWMTIHKTSCYIKEWISDGTNVERSDAMERCESGDLNTFANILTGVDETNCLTIIISEINGNATELLGI